MQAIKKNRSQILAIIPARGGSKGIPKKNLALVGGQPLIQYTLDAVKKSRMVTSAILSSDDDDIIAYCRARGIEVPFKRPDDLSKDHVPMLPVIIHAVSFLRDCKGYVPDYIVILQPTSPLRTGRHIDEAVGLLVNSEVDSVVSVVEVPHNFNPFSIMKLEGDYLKPYLEYNENLNIRQMKPKFFARNGAAIYAFTYDCLINKNSLYGEKILPYFMKKEESIDIDEPFDMMLADCILSELGARNAGC